MSSAYAVLRSSSNASTEALESAPDNRQIKRLRDLQEGLKRLQSMPNPKQLAKQDSMNKVGWLRQRLDALKMMLLHASPEQAKALVRELKNISSELASAAKSLGGSGSGQVAASGAEALNVTANGQALVASATGNLQAEATFTETGYTKETEGAANRTDVVPVNQDEPKAAPLGVAGESSQRNSGETLPPQDMSDRVLRGLLLDAKKLLKDVMDMLKPKLAAAGKEAKEDMRVVEKHMFELDNAMQQGFSGDFDTGQGQVSSWSSSSVDGANSISLDVSGLNINVIA